MAAPMKPDSARACAGFSAIVLVLALMVLSPTGGFGLAVIAALFAVFPAIRARGRVRIVAAVMLAASLGLAAALYPDFAAEHARYTERARR